MQRKFIVNLIFLLALNFLIKPFYILGIDAEIINEVGPEIYGLYFSLFNFSYLFNILLDLGVNNFNTRHIAQNEQLLSKYFSKLIGFKLLLALIYIVFTLIAGVVVGYTIVELKLLLLLLFNQGLVAIIMYLRSNLSGAQLFVKDSVISVLDRFLMIVICSVLLWGNVGLNQFKIEWFIYAQSVSYGLTLLLALYWVWSKASYIKIRFSKLYSLAIFKKSVPYALLILLMTFYYRVDSVMLERMLEDGVQQSGYYAQAYRFFEAANMIAYLFAVLLLPIFSKMIKLKQNLASVVNISFKILFAGAVILAVFCIQNSELIMSWKYHDLSPDSFQLFSVLMLCFVFISITYVFGTLLTANGNLKFLNSLASIALLVNVGLNFVLIPRYAALGSAIASLVTQFVVSFVQIIYAKTEFKFRVKASEVLQFIIFPFGVLSIGIWVNALALSYTVLSVLMFFTMSFMLAMLIKMIPLAQLVQIVKER